MPHRIPALAAALALLSAPALAATAHNSQLGADGPNNRTCDATPYFRAGGCLTETLTTGTVDQVLPGRRPAADAPYRPRPPLRGLGQ